MLGLVLVGMAVGYPCAAIALFITQSWLAALVTLSLSGLLAMLAFGLRLAVIPDDRASSTG
ncbi:hypothetical protein [Rhodovulum sulfidophilum]|uniref:Uncharacterized protein n=1 Tax=Rhodovulum sulfidophilum TaxID=35806 RepID=A0ABS1RP22_RHOSU|nr:hypothetical protein [Rhodovulum sulfidophilum]MBL3564700.1 hypothetical protein [Rhodovulum sulfidophilum]MBL3607800.1 hypothetical protein [Rhodovulum sulfidophilum]MCE8457479.1 hypothetical protein [Rhodovulum sulfidophilum]OLS52214.1 hypothetical protein BV392_09560 [Rhodovulum sulfidophilum]